ncbi:hypothetical protein [Rhizobium sp. MHM7A]|uniref:hypothetical protein n=1 Tax=Rhizobium sp. MHM7A TaxID=2583233 RepID=UPI0011064585|nr:hypothetical protein [Rhizobium sp. MHM7A]TLX16427.1 hypothetical protein FFR93_03580 [Rhizobium sp. MHM7A]
MRFFHGSAQFDSIMKDGLIPGSGIETDFSEDNRLVSLGGVYVTNDPKVAGFYAEMATQSEQSLGMDPCIFEIEITHHDLIADEDKVWSAIQDRVLRTYGLEKEEGGFDQEEIDAILAENDYEKDRLVSDVAFKLQTYIPHEEDEAVVYAAIRGFVLRSLCYEWDPAGENADEVAAINELCRRARCTLTDEWCRRQFGAYAITARTLSPIAAMGSDAEARIVGFAKLMLSRDGLQITGINQGGTLTVDDALALQETYIEKASNRGVVIEAFEAEAPAQTFG